MGEVLCSTENSPFLIIYHIHAKINLVLGASLAIEKNCMNVRKNKLYVCKTTARLQHTPIIKMVSVLVPWCNKLRLRNLYNFHLSPL